MRKFSWRAARAEKLAHQCEANLFSSAQMDVVQLTHCIGK